MSASEVARIREQIELECLSLAQLKNGFQTTASHEIITRKFAHLDALRAQLSHHLGLQRASELACDIYTQHV